MSACVHRHLLDLVEEEGHWILTNPGRIQRVADAFRRDDLTPSIAFFVGQQHKIQALQTLIPDHIESAHHSHGIANLLGAEKSLITDSALLYLDCIPGATCTTLTSAWTICHDNSRLTLSVGASSLTSIVAKLHVSLVFPLCHVVCVFVDDFVDVGACQLYVENWLQHVAPGGPPTPAAQPKLMLFTSYLENVYLLSQIESHQDFSHVFDGLQIVCIDEPDEIQPIRVALAKSLQHTRHTRSQNHLLFSLRHMSSMFDAAISSDLAPLDTLKMHQSTLDFVRDDRAVAHLQHVLVLYQTRLDQDRLVDLVASALLVQCYPRTVHSGSHSTSTKGLMTNTRQDLLQTSSLSE